MRPSPTTGPVQVHREDRATGTVYTEDLTMAPSSITTSSGVPTGAESISNIQTLTWQFYNNSSQLVNTDRYFTLSGVTYATGTLLAGDAEHQLLSHGVLL